MLDFFVVSTRSPKKDVVEIYPKFIIKKSEFFDQFGAKSEIIA